MIIQISKHLGETTTLFSKQCPARVERQEGETTKGEVETSYPAERNPESDSLIFILGSILEFMTVHMDIIMYRRQGCSKHD